MKRFVSLAVVLLILAVAVAPAFARYAVVVQAVNSSGGNNTPLFSMSGLTLNSGVKTTAPVTGPTGDWTGVTVPATGSYYATGGKPDKTGDWTFSVPVDKGGYYDVYYSVPTNTTSSTDLSPTWTIHNAGSDVTVARDQLTGANTWVSLATGLQFNAGTSYTTRMATPGTGNSSKRAYYDTVAWAASAPTVVTYTGIAHGAKDVALSGSALTWTPGNRNSFFDVYLGTAPGQLAKVATLGSGVTSYDLGELHSSTQYYWNVSAGNVDLSAPGDVYAFTTVPEPGIALGLCTGLIGLVGFARRRRD